MEIDRGYLEKQLHTRISGGELEKESIIDYIMGNQKVMQDLYHMLYIYENEFTRTTAVEQVIAVLKQLLRHDSANVAIKEAQIKLQN